MAKKPAPDFAAKAQAQGNRQAKQLLARRDAAIQSRQAALDQRARQLGAAAFVATAAPVAASLVATMGSTIGAGVLVAEGDSWFDYPLADVLSLLEDQHGYDVESVAHKGDRVEDMAYSGGQLEDFSRRLEKLLRRGIIPQAILLSGGGNDVAGNEFYMLLDHASSPTRGLNDAVVQGVIDQRVRAAYITILQTITRLCEERLQRRLPILLHGYDYPVPDGRGFLGGWWLLPGPWLAPGFQLKGYDKLDERKRIAKQLIDRFNDMVAGLVTLPGFEHVQYVNLRGTLSGGADYRTWWANELHPTEKGFASVVERFVAVLDALPA